MAPRRLASRALLEVYQLSRRGLPLRAAQSGLGQELPELRIVVGTPSEDVHVLVPADKARECDFIQPAEPV